MRELGPWQSDTCSELLCRAGILLLPLKEHRLLSDNLVFLLNKNVSFQSSFSATPGEQSGSSFGLDLQCKMRDGDGCCPVLRAPCVMPTFGVMDTCLTAGHWWILIPEKWWGTRAWVVCARGISCSLISIDYRRFVWLAGQNKLLLGLVFNGSSYLRAELQCYSLWMCTGSSLPSWMLLKVTVKPTGFLLKVQLHLQFPVETANLSFLLFFFSSQFFLSPSNYSP